ncbi:hypothetical protein K456DRAFT_1154207 [Colletotrichum gloeosporioides 23]|nr:hypothetical protein K456DRAFT_1154207 [Colletotrichum gloeosporioides 23]
MHLSEVCLLTLSCSSFNATSDEAWRRQLTRVPSRKTITRVPSSGLTRSGGSDWSTPTSKLETSTESIEVN